MLSTPDRLQAPRVTRALLICGVVAGPVYLIVGLVQALTRPGFDITRHDLSLLSNGDLGWIQVANLLLTGLLTVLAAVGMRRAMPSGRGRAAAPVLVAIYGLGTIGAGLFSADPAFGFPPGTPATANSISWHGLLHFVCGGVGFLALIVACFIFARRFATKNERTWSVWSVVTGVVFLAAFFGIAAGSGNSWTVLGFWIGILTAWAWVATVCLHLRRESSR